MTPMDVLIVVERFFLYWLAYSFAGWVWETGLSVVLRKRFEDRGMLNGPICPIYGFGGLLVVVLLVVRLVLIGHVRCPPGADRSVGAGAW